MTTLPALVFDFDGTLIESAPEIRACVNILMEEHGRPTLTLPQVEKMIGKGVAFLVEEAFEATGGQPDDFEAALAHFIDVYNNAPIDETPEMIDAMTSGTTIILRSVMKSVPSQPT